MLSSFRRTAISTIVLLEVINMSYGREHESRVRRTCCSNNSTDLEVRVIRNAETGRGMMDHHDDHAMEEPKSKPWLGYYDFLITEGSYKFWVVFELFTIAILIYSAFAALYYAKYTINDYENYDDYFLGRSARSLPPTQTAFLGLPVETYLQIFNAVANFNNKFS